MQLFKRLIIALLLLIILLIAVVAGWVISDRQDDYDVSLDGVNIPAYETSDIIFNQGNDFSSSLPFLASAIIDVDGDGVEELFLGGSKTTPDGLFRFENNRLNPIKGALGITNKDQASMGSVVVDVDNDGRQDLLVAREDGIWLHHNQGDSFSNQLLDAMMPEESP